MIEEIIFKIRLTFVPCPENNYRPRFLESKFLFYYLLFLLVLKLISLFYLISLPRTIFFADLSKAILLQLLNQERKSLGLNPLRENPQLSQAAYLKAEDMIAQDYFSHQSPEGKLPWYWIKLANYDYQLAGENLAIGFLDSEEVYQAWKNSPSHKANLFNPNYQDIGMAILKGDFQGNETFLVVQFFATPKIKPVGKEKPSEKEKPVKIEEKISPEKPEISPEREVVPEEIKPSLVYFPSLENGELKNSFGFNFFRFLSTDYNDLIQKIIFSSLLLIIISLITNIFVKFDVQHQDLILKTIFFIALLALFIYFDKESIIRFVPHNLSIY